MNRALEAGLLARSLTQAAGLTVEVRWHPSSGSKRRQWHVIWTDGPSPATMSDLVIHATRDYRALNPATLAYHRTIHPRTIALTLIRGARDGQRPRSASETLRQLAEQLRHTDYPEHATPDEIALADTLTRLARHREALMPRTLTRYGLAGLRAHTSSADNVIPLPPPPDP